jgi:methionyl-tRNA formyltransferase
MDGLSSGALLPLAQSQDPAQSLRCFPRTPEDGEIDWRQPARLIARLVRASAEPFAGAFTHLLGERLTIWRARPDALPYPSLGVSGQVVRIDAVRGEAWVLAGEGVLILEEVEWAGKRGKATEFIHSTRMRISAGTVTAVQLQSMQSKLDALERQIATAQRTKSDDR